MFDRNMLNSVRRVAFVALLATAALSANAFVIKTETFYSNIVSGDTSGTVVSTLAKFDPTLGTLLNVEVGTVASSQYSYTVSNAASTVPPTTEDVKYSVQTWASVSVASDPTFATIVSAPTLSSLSASGEDSALPQGDALTGSDSNVTGPKYVNYTGSDLAMFTASGSDNVLGVSQEYFNHSRFQGSNIDQHADLLAGSQARVVYTYEVVPAPAAAGSMLIGLVGTLARRRRKA